MSAPSLLNITITLPDGKIFHRDRVTIEPADWGPPRNHKQVLTIVEPNGTRTEFPPGSFRRFHFEAVPL